MSCSGDGAALSRSATPSAVTVASAPPAASAALLSAVPRVMAMDASRSGARVERWWCKAYPLRETQTSGVSPEGARRCNPQKSSPDILLHMTRIQMAVVGAFFGVAFAISGVIRGNAAPGIVGGILGGVLVYLVLLRVTEHHADLKRRRENRDG
jgi:hypothetical protein